jgi:glycosyltransferase involved in cell wall biosynthesis
MVEEALEAGSRPGPNWLDPIRWTPTTFVPVLRSSGPLRRELNIGADAPVAVFVGRLDPQKGIAMADRRFRAGRAEAA